MNLKELRNKIFTIMDYQPENLSYKKQIDGLINDAYLYLWMLKKWTFAQKIEYFNFYRDILPADITGGGGAQTALVTDMSRLVSFSGNIRQFTTEPVIYEGQIFECQGRDYRILKVVSSTEIRLEEPFRGTTNSSETDWRIKHRYYSLPEDCIEVLSLSHRDAPVPGSAGAVRGKIIGLSNRLEEDYSLEEDRTATYADYYICVPPITIPPGEKLKATILRSEPSPVLPVGNLKNNTFYEFCWAFESEGGLVGPLSESLIVEVTPAGVLERADYNAIEITYLSHDDQDIDAPTFNEPTDIYKNPYEGLRKRLYFNQNFNRLTGERLGLPLWRAVVKGSLLPSQYNQLPLRSEDESATEKVSWLEQINSGNPRYIECDGQHLRIRPYPRVNAADFEYDYSVDGDTSVVSYEQFFMQAELRYRKKPIPLCSDTDVPDMPFEMHQLIVYKALEDTYIKANNPGMGDQYRKKIDKDVRALETRYCQRVDTFTQKGSFTGGLTYNGRYDPNSLRKTN